jgi:tetratricopeptide (TPR) repeat protein
LPSFFQNQVEAVVFFIFFGVYIAIRVLFGGGESAWEKQQKKFRAGLEMIQKKDWEAAWEYFQKRNKRWPFETLPWVMLGEISLHQGDNEQAVFFAQKALRLDNTITEAHLLMSKGLQALGEFETAFQIAQKAAWFGRNHAEANRLAGLLFLEKGNVEKGIHHLERAFSLGDEEAQMALKTKNLKNKNWK